MATIPLKTITFPGLDNTYTVPQLDDTLTTAGKAADAKATGDKLDELEASEATKANVDGSYEQMTVGNAEQLVSSIKEEDKVPYLFRTSGGSIDIGDREEDKIVGGTVAWNQMYTPSYVRSQTTGGVTFTVQSDGTIVANGTSEGTGDIYYALVREISKIGHVLLVTGCPTGGSNNTYRIYLDGHGAYSYDTGNGAIFKQVYDNKRLFIYINKNNVELNNKKFAPQFVDLTQMFGTTIADYIYSLEQATAGAGVAWFRKLFPKPYYEYNAGQLMSVKALSHDTTGFNQWDKSGTISGGYLTKDGNVASSENFKYTDYIHIVPNTTYHFQNIGGSNPSICWYDAAKQFISGTSNSEAIAKNLTSPANAQYVRVSFPKENVDTLCVNLHWDGSRDGEYEPYVKHSYPLDSTLTLCGIPKLDANNSLYYDGDEYSADGTVTRKYGIVDLGTLDWTATYTEHVFSGGTITPEFVAQSSGAINMLSTKYNIAPSLYIASGIPNNMISKQSGTTNKIIIRDDSYSDATTFTNALSGVYIVYELATPTTEEADPYQNPQIVDDFGTEEYVINNTVTVPIPVGHDTFYQANLVAKLEMAPVSPEGDGDYIVRQTNGENAYVPITFPADELPAAPTTDGNYVLKCTVASGTATFTWEAQS